MGFFDALGKLGKAAVGAALLPVDAVRVAGEELLEGDSDDHVSDRLDKIGNNLGEALEEIDE